MQAHRSHVQSEIWTRTIECARVGGLNLAQSVFDSEALLPETFPVILPRREDS